MSITIWQSLSQTPWLEPLTRRAPPPTPVAVFPDRFGVHRVHPGLQVDLLGLDEIEAMRGAWRDLMARALEPNVFMEPAFALTAAQHFPQSRRPRFIGVREEIDGGRADRLLCLWPIESSMSLLAPGIVQGWRHPLTNLGLPVIDRARATEVADIVLNFVAEHFASKSALVVPRLLRAGPTFGLLVTRALATGRAWSLLEEHERAILRRGHDAETFERDILPPKRRKELERQWRRLRELGPIVVRTAREPDEIRHAMELFLAMEQKGWKGRRRTSLLSDPASTAFARAMTRLMARDGKCRVDWIEVGGTPAAMGIVLTSGDRAYFWKTAYDESFARFSPGVQLVRALTLAQLSDTGIVSTDSCAISTHPMIDRLWPDRQAVVDVLLALSPDRAKAYGRTASVERMRRHLRASAKSLLHATLARKRN
jgi:CelD/BcsL family acetyltransferase involved in cellulose biosynthesis